MALSAESTSGERVLTWHYPSPCVVWVTLKINPVRKTQMQGVGE